MAAHGREFLKELWNEAGSEQEDELIWMRVALLVHITKKIPLGAAASLKNLGAFIRFIIWTDSAYRRLQWATWDLQDLWHDILLWEKVNY